MAIAVTTVWEIRTTGSATNGGGFNSAIGGSDYSTQDNAELTVTISCPNSTTVTGSNFTAAMVGNIMYIINDASAASLFEIVSVDLTTQVTIDRTPGTVTNKTAYVGGAQSQITTVLAVVPVATSTSGNILWIKAGTYVDGTNFTTYVRFLQAGHYAKHHKMIGYNTTRGDATVPCVIFDGNNTSSTSGVYYADKSYIDLSYIEVNCYVGGTYSGASNRPGFDLVAATANSSEIYRCKGTNTGIEGFRVASIGARILNCEATGFGTKGASSGFLVGGNNTAVIGCYAHDGTGIGFDVYAAAPGVMAYNIADNCSTFGGRMNSASTISVQIWDHCIFYKCTSGGLVSPASGARPTIVINCIISENGGPGISAVDTRTHVTLLGSAFYNNTSTDIDTSFITLNEIVPRITLTADPFVDAANGDFRIKSSAIELIRTGWPSTFLSGGGLTTWGSDPDYGATEHIGGNIVGPLINGGLVT